MNDVPDGSKGLGIAAYARDAAILDAERFAKKHGSAFLVHSQAEALQVPSRPQSTAVGAPAYVPGRGSASSTASAAHQETGWDEPPSLRVWPIRKSGHSLIGRFISVGRTHNNDVVISDVSLSKFHAIFLDEGGSISLQDGRSRNGTFVHGERVSKQGDGPPIPVRSGARVRFGSVELTFLDAASLRRLVLTLSRAVE